MDKNVVVTGAGSGVGRACALALSSAGWKVAVLGRRLESLEETASLAGKKNSHDFLCLSCDLADPAAIRKASDKILNEFGTVNALVNAAGTNIPQRSLEVLTPADYQYTVDTNLNGCYYLIQSFLPSMRKHRNGTIVNVISDAAKQASPKAGPAYVVSKFGLLGLTQSINAEERGNGIRACALLPGDIDTPLLDKRPQPPAAEARSKMLQPEDIAACVMFALNLPERAIVEELLIRPRG